MILTSCKTFWIDDYFHQQLNEVNRHFKIMLNIATSSKLLITSWPIARLPLNPSHLLACNDVMHKLVPTSESFLWLWRNIGKSNMKRYRWGRGERKIRLQKIQTMLVLQQYELHNPQMIWNQGEVNWKGHKNK